MPRSKDMGLRLRIIEGHQKGQSLRDLAFEHGISYVTVQMLCIRYNTSGVEGLKPRYGHCGKRRPDSRDMSYRAVRCYKTWHPTWGAQKIRTELLLKDPDLKLPGIRTLQNWFHSNGQTTRRSKQPRTEAHWAKSVHEVWQIDAKEEMQTLDGRKNCWLNIKDERSGAVIEPPVFPL